MDKSIKLAKTAGFCFGVNRAIELVNSLLDDGQKVWKPLRHRMTLQDALEVMEMHKGRELRLIVQNERRYPFQCR